MLIIETKNRYITWHVGQPFPKLNLGPQSSPDGDGRVIDFQADGHELSYLLEVMRGFAKYSYQIGVEGARISQDVRLFDGREVPAEDTLDQSGLSVCSYCDSINRGAYKGSCPRCPKRSTT